MQRDQPSVEARRAERRKKAEQAKHLRADKPYEPPEEESQSATNGTTTQQGGG